VKGEVHGFLAGGNLAVLSSLVGTPLMPELSGSILCLEDTDEPPYRLDRMIRQLLSSGALKNAFGWCWRLHRRRPGRRQVRGPGGDGAGGGRARRAGRLGGGLRAPRAQPRPALRRAGPAELLRRNADPARAGGGLRARSQPGGRPWPKLRRRSIPPQRLRTRASDGFRRAPRRRRARRDARLLAGLQLPGGRHDLPARQPAPAGAPAAGAHQGAAPRALGGEPRPVVRLHPPEPGDPRPRRQRRLPGRARPRRPRRPGAPVPRGDLFGDLPRQEPRPRGPAALLPPVLVPGRHRQPLHARDPRLAPRGRRARLRPVPRLRRGVRQSRPRRRGGGRRRRGRDRPAGDLLARRQVPEPGARRRGAPGAEPQRLQDQQPDPPGPHQPRGAPGAVSGYGWKPYFVEGSDFESMHQAMAATLDRCFDEIQAVQAEARAAGRRAGRAGR